MADKLVSVAYDGIKKRMRDMGNGSHAEVVDTGAVVQAVPDTTLATMSQYYTFGLTAGDFVKTLATANGQFLTALSLDPLTAGGQSVVYLKSSASVPHLFEIEATLSQRTRGPYAVAELVSDPASVDAATPLALASISQSTTTLTFVLSSVPANDINIGDHITVTGLTDSRLCYHNVCVATRSNDKLTYTATVENDQALPSLTVGPYVTQGYVIPLSQTGGASDAYGWRFTGIAATVAAIFSKFGGNESQMSGTFNGSQSTTIASTAPVFTAAATGAYDVKATSRFTARFDPRRLVIEDVAVDSQGASTVRATRTGVKPSTQGDYYVRFRGVRPASMTRPVGKIVSATHATAATATDVVMDVTPSSAGIVVGSYVTLRNINNQTTFANSATAVAVTAVNDGTKTISLAWGAATAGTSYGGSVILHQGGYDQPGLIGQAIQSVARDAAGIVTLIGSASWSGTQIGELYNFHGVRDAATGADLGFDGVYELLETSTATARFKPVVADITASGVGVPLATLSGVVTTTNAGGSVILRTTMRSHDFLLESYAVQRTQIDGQGSVDITKAVPMNIVADQTTGTARVMQGSQANQSATVPQPVLASVYGVSANPTAGTTGRQQQVLGTLIGAVVVKPYSLPEADWRYTGTLTTNVAVAARAAGAAGIKNYVTGIQLQNTNAVATTFLLQDGATTIWQISLPASMSLPIPFEFPTALAGTAATAMNVNCGTTGANVITNVQGYFAP